METTDFNTVSIEDLLVLSEEGYAIDTKAGEVLGIHKEGADE